LGSGKTTFIKEYVKYLTKKGKKAGIIENDFGAISVDSMILNNELPEDTPVEMVVASDMDCYLRRFKTKLISFGMLGLDRVIVEPSGIFDADEFFDIINDEPLERWYEIGSVISVVDASIDKNLSDDSKYLFLSQIANAGIILINKLEKDNKNVKSDLVSCINEIMKENNCSRRLTIEDTVSYDFFNYTDADFKRIMEAGYVSADFGKRRVLVKNLYKTIFFYNAIIKKDDIKTFIDEIFDTEKDEEVYRIKGFVPEKDDEEKISWIEINATREIKNIKYNDQGQEVILIIGENPDEVRIQSIVKKYSENKDITSGHTAHYSH
jgi:G3E family GTPase